MIKPINTKYSALVNGKYTPRHHCDFNSQNLLVRECMPKFPREERTYTSRYTPDFVDITYEKKRFTSHYLKTPEQIVREFEERGWIVYPSNIHVATSDQGYYVYAMYCRELTEQEILNQKFEGLCDV